jgi:superfamily II helicase
MLTKQVDGKVIVLDEKEEANVRAFWDMNTRFPEYIGHCCFDGVNTPIHDMNSCKAKHVVHIKKCVDLALEDLRISIEDAQENGQDTQALLNKRKEIKQLEKQDLTGYENIVALKNSVPSDLVPYWKKATSLD